MVWRRRSRSCSARTVLVGERGPFRHDPGGPLARPAGIAMDLERLLEGHGFRVLGPATTVAGALHLLGGETPDVALLDVNLRGEMVTLVAEALRARGVPFVLASAYDGSQL